MHTATYRGSLDRGGIAGRSSHEPTMLKVAIGRQVRSFRTKLGITGIELAVTAGLSAGMLSKIENGDVSPSLATLLALSRGLSVPVTALLQKYENEYNAIFVKASDGVYAGSHDTHDCRHHMLEYFNPNISGMIVKPCFVTISDEADMCATSQHGGVEFLYLIDGQLDFWRAGKLYSMMPGDSLLFNAAAPHGPEYLRQLPIRYLSIVSNFESKSGG